MLFWLSRRKQEEWFEKIRSEQEYYAEQNRQATQEQLDSFQQSIIENQRITEENMEVYLEQVIRNNLAELANFGSIEKLEKELVRYREENERLIKYIKELLCVTQSIKDSVDKLQRQVEDLGKERNWTTPFQWMAPVQPQVPPLPQNETGTVASVPPISKTLEASVMGTESSVKKWTGVPLEAEVTKRTLPTTIVTPVFTCDRGENKHVLAECIFQCGELKKVLEQKISADRSFDIYYKLLEKCQKKLGDLLRKIDEKDYDSEKLASEMIKLLKQTMIKALSQETVHDLVDSFLIKCGLRKIEFKKGDKLADKDYDYIDDLVLYEEVDDVKKDNRILEIKQDAYALDYVDENGETEAVIPGIYRIGRYKDF